MCKWQLMQMESSTSECGFEFIEMRGSAAVKGTQSPSTCVPEPLHSILCSTTRCYMPRRGCGSRWRRCVSVGARARQRRDPSGEL
jgi:hypothetical protein